MLTFGADRPFHARVDLPPSGSAPADVGEVVGSLLAPAVHHGVPRVVFVLYSATPVPAERVSRRLVRAFRAADIEVIDVIRADGHRWFPLLRKRRSHPAGVPYDVSSHPFAAQSVLDGRVTLASRDELVATLAPDPAGAERVAAAVGRRGTPDAEPWVRATTRRLVAARQRPGDDEAARLLVAAGDLDVSMPAWAEVSRQDAGHHVELWSDLVRRAPGELAAPAAAVLAFLAWRAGHGALAWCAIDRAEAAAPGHPLAVLVGELLSQAVPPHAWDERPPLADPA
jgi:hypothetical protein